MNTYLVDTDAARLTIVADTPALAVEQATGQRAVFTSVASHGYRVTMADDSVIGVRAL